MYEIIRLADIHPIGVLHSPSADADVAAGRYDVPAGSFVFPNFHHALRDPELWSHPNELRPEENWLNNNNLSNSSKPGEFQGASRPGFVSFGMGRRKCPGQDMALTMLFAFVGNLIQVRVDYMIYRRSKIEINFSLDICFNSVKNPVVISV